MSCGRLAAHPRDERDTASICCGHQRRRRGPKGEGDGRYLVACFLGEHWRRGQQRQRGETHDGFLLSGEVFVWELPLARARCWKGDALAAAARRRFFEAGGRELARGSGRRGRSWMRQRTADWHLFGMRLSLASSLELRWEAVGRGRCPSQKGSGAEAVCLE
ncbi:hypothetical protein DFH08DRAFT_1011108 [Mycena albidolilacea]|uniref:Uncharacterized protein n=1 Tax=Mycena albidolilacea TaxID=1033008 RepID=A0AAD7EN85_9AGAR|nr:hypothetical protein DFH08DRAFT_1011108 [Mycena albidolilacea]